MFGAVNLPLIFLFFKTIDGELPSPEAKFGRNTPTSNLHLILQKDENQDILDLEGVDNVQKLISKQNQYFDKEPNTFNNEKNLVPDEPAYSGKSKNGKNKGATPQNVNRVQELTGQLWPMGVVPFFVDKEIYDPTTVKRIIKAMNAIESVSCVIFKELQKKPKDNPDGWLHFTNPSQERECVHIFATVDGGTEVVLGFDCLHPDEILHSLLHALGFRDEVTHPHRDQYIRILWNNIQPKHRGLFRIRHEDASHKLVEYDPMSIMHFHDRAFTDNGAATITAIIPGLQIASTTTLSQLDIMRLKLAFSHECNKRNIGDLLITCKKSLTPQKNNQEDLADVGAEEKIMGSEIKLKDGQNESDEKKITKKYESLDDYQQLQGGAKELHEEIESEIIGDEDGDQDEEEQKADNSEQSAGEGIEVARKEADERIPNRFRSVHQYKKRG